MNIVFGFSKTGIRNYLDIGFSLLIPTRKVLALSRFSWRTSTTWTWPTLHLNVLGWWIVKAVLSDFLITPRYVSPDFKLIFRWNVHNLCIPSFNKLNIINFFFLPHFLQICKKLKFTPNFIVYWNTYGYSYG